MISGLKEQLFEIIIKPKSGRMRGNMSGLLDAEGGIMSALNKFWDMVVLSIMWAVLSGYCIILTIIAANCGFPNITLPILILLQMITLGPATAALYYTCVKTIRRGRGYITKEFFKAFKSNFKTGASAALTIAVGVYIIWIDYQYANSLSAAGDNSAFIYFTGCNIFAIFLVLTGVMIFPVMSRFNVSFKELIKLSLTMAVRHIFTTIAVMALLVVSAVIVILFIPALFIVPAGCMVLCSMLIERVFKKYMPKPDKPDEESGKDTWYYE